MFHRVWQSLNSRLLKDIVSNRLQFNSLVFLVKNVTRLVSQICTKDRRKLEGRENRNASSPDGRRKGCETVANNIEILQTHELSEGRWERLQLIRLKIQYPQSSQLAQSVRKALEGEKNVTLGVETSTLTRTLHRLDTLTTKTAALRKNRVRPRLFLSIGSFCRYSD